MVLVHASDRVLEVRILGGDHNGKSALIPQISLRPSAKNSDFTFTLEQHQFLVHLAFTMTINKAQGQSVKVVGLDLHVLVFGHGQLYVAPSHAISGRQITALLPPGQMKTLNVIYLEVLIR